MSFIVKLAPDEKFYKVDQVVGEKQSYYVCGFSFSAKVEES